MQVRGMFGVIYTGNGGVGRALIAIRLARRSAKNSTRNPGMVPVQLPHRRQVQRILEQCG